MSESHKGEDTTKDVVVDPTIDSETIHSPIPTAPEGARTDAVGRVLNPWEVGPAEQAGAIPAALGDEDSGKGKSSKKD